jgi:hypothetical protein
MRLVFSLWAFLISTTTWQSPAAAAASTRQRSAVPHLRRVK